MLLLGAQFMKASNHAGEATDSSDLKTSYFIAEHHGQEFWWTHQAERERERQLTTARASKYPYKGISDAHTVVLTDDVLVLLRCQPSYPADNSFVLAALFWGVYVKCGVFLTVIKVKFVQICFKFEVRKKFCRT